ncbi:non-homologous end-joining DNA ligase [Ornithinimicrobium sp. INDO-MA30-4]|uniref:non-homologous end-joining DNA ligase n=1 Tax=Ornithinimicrobium sp. INDO-MA30-4 TaxID=2908651 RepID=UPI001F4616FB|nr:non-homologous end-joining DNA ligase [Ornithinimicrobium sp. INDO-MA30-4]UJH71198.1 non-homologous end-joining DNA ligase [Ornithinimicrobium sp. INDO-MA30-4]
MASATTIPIPTPDGSERKFRVSSPDRVLYPASESGPELSKLDVVKYLVAVGEPLMRSLQDRPVTLQRFPTGIEGEEFYSKNPPRGVPEWARSVMVTYPSGRQHKQLVIDEIATAAWAAQMNTLTFHPWPVRTSNVDNPDEIRLDLDPQPGRPFSDIVKVARALANVMRPLGLTPMVKTTGNRGLHVFAPIKADWEFLEVRHAVIAIAREVERSMPDVATTAWWKEERGDKVFLDFNQACRDRTLAAAWSPRPRPGAPVSMPVSWDELDGVSPEGFSIYNAVDRLNEVGDAWADLHAEGRAGDLTEPLKWWDRDLDNGLTEMPFPPDYPKMPGEPRRVQPSRKKQD